MARHHREMALPAATSQSPRKRRLPSSDQPSDTALMVPPAPRGGSPDIEYASEAVEALKRQLKHHKETIQSLKTAVHR